jgi:hypothetical protein
MNSNKYFKVKEIVNREGKVVYKVLGADNKWDVIFGVWDTYSFENKTLEDAIEHIELLFRLGIKSEKIVYKTDISRLK